MSSSETTQVYKVQVLERALNLLNSLAECANDASLAELSETVGLHKSTVHRLLSVLEQHRFVEKTEAGRYRLGLKLFELGSKAVSGLDLRNRSRRHLERLAGEANETVHLCILDDGEVLYVDKVEPARSVRMASSVGRRMPAHCTAVGKAMMAFLPEPELSALIRRHQLVSLTPHTITTQKALKHELEIIREEGFALDREENELGVNCIAAPVRDYSGQVVAALSISGPTFRVNESSVPLLISTLVSATQALSTELGFRTPEASRV